MTPTMLLDSERTHPLTPPPTKKNDAHVKKTTQIGTVMTSAVTATASPPSTPMLSVNADRESMMRSVQQSCFRPHGRTVRARLRPLNTRKSDVRGRRGKMGRVLRWTTAGESHGRALVAVVEGMVAGVHVTSDDIAGQLARRRLGYGRGARMKFEQDQVTVLAGVRHGVTLGGPIAIEVGNTEWPKWETVMAPDPVDPAVLEDSARNAPLTRPRPGHADYAGMLKYGFDDARPVLERASARETAARVAAGTVARAFLREALGVEVLSHVISIGASKPYDGSPPRAADLAAIDASPVRAYDKAAEDAMIAEIEAAKKDGDTLGGVVEVVANGLPVGLGSFTSGDNRLDSQLAAAVMGVQAIKGVEIGDGFETARRRGSVAHDEMYPGPDGVMRSTNRAGGLEGGMTNGQPLRVRAAMKPISTVPRALATVDMATGDEAVAIHQRSDVCAVPAAGVVVETMVALVLARAALEKFGGDSLAETRANIDNYRRAVADTRAVGAAGTGVGLMAPKAVLVGMPGSGKSTIGRRLAKAMQLPLLDTDAKIVETTGRSIADLFVKGSRCFAASKRMWCASRWRSTTASFLSVAARSPRPAYVTRSSGIP